MSEGISEYELALATKQSALDTVAIFVERRTNLLEHLTEISDDPAGCAVENYLSEEDALSCNRFIGKATLNGFSSAGEYLLIGRKDGVDMWGTGRKISQVSKADGKMRKFNREVIWRGLGYPLGYVPLPGSAAASRVILSPSDTDTEATGVLRIHRYPVFPISKAFGFGRLPDPEHFDKPLHIPNLIKNLVKFPL